MLKKIKYVLQFRYDARDEWFIHPLTGEVITNLKDAFNLITR